jgi:threonine/homoserine/homoserine lactone efflux protein
MNNAAKTSFLKALPFNFGVFAGIFLIMTLCLGFSAALYAVIPKVQFPMKIIGALYMLYLIVKTVIPEKKHKTKEYGAGFLIGILLQFINPKLIIFGITVMSSYILPYYSSLPAFAFFILLLAFTGFTGTLCWSLFGSLFSALFIKHGKLLNAIMIILLLYCAVSLFL